MSDILNAVFKAVSDHPENSALGSTIRRLVTDALTSPQLHQHGGGVNVDALAQEIRRVDGNHSLGAGALAEALLPFLTAALALQPLSVPFSDEGAAWVNARSAMINMPMNSPDYRAKLNALSEAENNLVAAIRAHPTQSDVSCSRAREGGTGE